MVDLLSLTSTLMERRLRVRVRDNQVEVVGPEEAFDEDLRAGLLEHRDTLFALHAPRVTREHIAEASRTILAMYEEELGGAPKLGPGDIPVWDGEDLGQEFAFDCETELASEKGETPRVPRVALASVANANESYLVHPSRLASFVQQHALSLFLTHNGGSFDFHVVHQAIAREKAVEKLWWHVAAEGRLRDTMWLDALIRLARHDSFPKPRDLGTVAQEYAGIKVDKDDPYRLRYAEIIGQDWERCERGFFEYAIRDPQATYAVYQEQKAIAEGLAIDVAEEARRSFGLLTETLQTRSAIALEAIHRQGLAVDSTRVEAAREKAAQSIEEAVAPLEEMAPGLFKRRKKDKSLIRTQNGVPSKSETVLREKVGQIAERCELSPPVTTKGITLSRKYWEELTDEDPFLIHWTNFESMAKLYQFYRGLGEERIHPRYTVLVRSGRTSCHGPNIQQLPKGDGFREMIIPSEGHVFFNADYAALELRTFAAVLEGLYGQGNSVLADTFRQGIDPHAKTAALVVGLSLEEFLALKRDDPAFYGSRRQAAKAINFGTPAGLSAPSLVAYARATYGVEMSEEEAEAFRQKVITEVYPEWEKYLAEDIHQIMADSLGTDRGIIEVLFPQASGTRNLVRGNTTQRDGEPWSKRWVNEQWRNLKLANQRPYLKVDIEGRRTGEELYRRLFWTPVTTLSGRIRGRVSYTQKRNTPFQAAAADGGKLLLFRLCREGYRVAAWIHDEVLIELPEADDYREPCCYLQRVMIEEMQRACPDIPIEVEYVVASRWSKKATLVEQEGRIVPWEEAG